MPAKLAFVTASPILARFVIHSFGAESIARGDIVGMLELVENDVADFESDRDLYTFQAIVEKAPCNIIAANRNLEITYVNERSLETLRKYQSLLPIRVEDLVGQNIDIFHKNPGPIRQKLLNPENLPHRARIKLGDEVLELNVSAITNDKGEYLGPFVIWSVISEQERNAQMQRDNTATNGLLNKLSHAKTIEQCANQVLSGMTEDFGFEFAAIVRKDSKSRLLQTRQSEGKVDTSFKKLIDQRSSDLENGLVAQVWNSGEVKFSSDLRYDYSATIADAARTQNLSSTICIPVTVREQTFAVLEAWCGNPASLHPTRLAVFQALARAISSAMDRVYRTQQLEFAVEKLLQVVECASQKDLTCKIPKTGDETLDSLANGIGRMINDLRTIIAEVIDGARQFSEGAAVVADTAQNLAHCSQNQNATVEEMSAAIEEVTTNIQSIRDKANEANNFALETTKMAQEGGKAVNESLDAMTRIKKSSEQINEIIQVISEIASQTNLLALNAAIEAARAGQHGLGFAVVADEVRKLAERASEAAKEIKGLISESAACVEQGAQLSARTESSLRRIIEGVETTAAKISEIAAATAEQAQNAAEVSNAIERVAQVSEQLANSSEQMASGSQELGAQAETMRRLVADFKV